MSKNFKIDPIDEALKLIYLESSSIADNAFSISQLQHLLHTDYMINIADHDKEAMLTKLFSYASSASLGNLLNEAIEQKNISAQSLSQNLKISLSIIEDLKADKIFTNNIPVVFIKNILHALNISFKKAETAILKTFELLKSQAVIEEVSFRSMQPTFRKGFYASRENSAWFNKNNIVESRDLFENEEALKKYLLRLDELMNK